MTPPVARLDRTKLLAARFRAAQDRPYLASALFALSVVESAAVPTMAVDRFWRCYVNAGFVGATPVPQLAGVWIHEVAHLLRDHHGRAERLPTADRPDRTRVNIAQDCEINDDLIQDRLVLPPGHVTPATFGQPTGRLFEEYLPHVPPTPPCPACQAGGHGACADCGAPRCGSGACGGAEPWDLAAADGGRVSPAEAHSIRRYTAEAVRAHQRSRGTTPAGWRRWADALLEPTVDWRQVLAGSVRQAIAWASGAVDYTYRRPSRRSAAQARVVLPSMRRPSPSVAIVVDTSGSMTDDDLSAAMAEVAGVLREVGVRGNRVTVLSCDAAVSQVRRIARAEELELVGGGGTDMRIGIATALAQPTKPHVVVVLTDGFTPWPEEPPGARVIAGLIGTDPPDPPEWIERIRIT